MKKTLLAGLLAVLVTGGCDRPRGDAEPGATGTAAPPPASAVDPSFPVGQVIYIPAYSVVSMATRDRTMPLAVTLSVHNTDMERPIVLSSVRYHDNDGKLLREFLPSPVELPALATKDFLVERTDSRKAGRGANFIVTWGAVTTVSEPLIEALMVSSGTQGISFLSQGRVISQKP